MTTYAAQTADPHAPEWARSKSHLCGAIATLKAQLDQHYPTRDHTSDGFIGDARHLAEGTGSDHNPWVSTALGWAVRAGDFDVDGINPAWLAEQLRLAGYNGDPRLIGGGYVIWNGHITLHDFSGWTPYVGDPHLTHLHVTVTRSAACEITDPWRFLDAAAPAGQPTDPGPVRPPAAPAPAPAPAPARAWNEGMAGAGHDAAGAGAALRAEIGNEGPVIANLQRELNRIFPAYSMLIEDGCYGRQTADVLANCAHRAGQDPHTPDADREGLAGSDGRNIGPRLARAFGRYGLNV